MALTVGLLIAISLYLLMSNQLNRWLYGLILFSSSINICLLIAGRVFLSQPAFIKNDPMVNLGNPLPQAMVLTAIVISFALIAFSLIIVRELYKENDVKKQFNSPSLPLDKQGDDE
ncbi:sodium:proton antiporter [Legionella yabuuchiae]|uniref:sodium:proton antiporter n=1 Tax=Legionella yabuuchiae TaxID=376727 RepID=UPI001054CE93|nr:NADH-quinone oxidoreductase subunit K [Legionella yabuuchiae]